MGIGDKVREVAHKMGVGHTGEQHAGEHHHTPIGTSYENTGATYGAAGAPGIAAPVDPAGTYGATGAPIGTGTGLAGTERAYGEGYREGGEGYREGYETRTATAEVPVVQQTTTTAAVQGVVEGGAAVRAEGGEKCGAEYFTKVEDRPVVKERVEQVMEHRPVAKEYVVETRQTGAERETGAREVEHLGTQERVVGAGPVTAMGGEGLAGEGLEGHHHHHKHHGHHTGTTGAERTYE